MYWSYFVILKLIFFMNEKIMPFDKIIIAMKNVRE